jgi:hypothetical protein
MNEQIRKLAEQAGFYYTDKTGFITPAGCDPAKFAELIIAECVDIADDYVKDYCVEEHIKFNHPRSKIGLKIKEHFGVGE